MNIIVPETSDSLAVESHVFGIGLRNSNMVTILEKDPDGLGISRWITTGKTLIGHIEECKMLFGLE